MRLIPKFISNLFGGRADESEPMNLRRWDASKTDRLNQAQWQGVTGNPINRDLAGNLDILRARSHHEASRNPFIEGMIRTWVNDVVGEQGPVLQVQSSDKAYNDALEAAWRTFWDMPDLNGMYSGVDMMRMWVRSDWPNGEFIVQLVTDSSVNGPVKTRLNNIDPRRMKSNCVGLANRTGGNDLSLGVERTKTGKPINYWIEDPDDGELGGFVGAPKAYPAKDIIHDFEPTEPGQARGIPLMATNLQVAADLRDYDIAVLDAARQAADNAVLLYSDHIDAPFVNVNESTPVQRRQMQTIPPGWKTAQMKAEQPTTVYSQFRGEKLRELGRPVGMPLMMVALDSSKHNFSSANLDTRNYGRSVVSRQGRISRTVLNRLVGIVAREAELAKATPKRPADVRYVWTWPVPPSSDPGKQADADARELANGSISLTEVCSRQGRDFDQVLASRSKEMKSLIEAGMPVTMFSPPNQPQQSAAAKPGADDDEPTDTTEGDDAENRMTPHLNGVH
jgi:lambda family phage portal protein